MSNDTKAVLDLLTSILEREGYTLTLEKPPTAGHSLSPQGLLNVAIDSKSLEGIRRAVEMATDNGVKLDWRAVELDTGCACPSVENFDLARIVEWSRGADVLRGWACDAIDRVMRKNPGLISPSRVLAVAYARLHIDGLIDRSVLSDHYDGRDSGTSCAASHSAWYAAIHSGSWLRSHGDASDKAWVRESLIKLIVG